MQAAAFALFTDNREMIRFCTERYKTVLLPNQMAADGSFPLELERTKPYGYSLFNLDSNGHYLPTAHYWRRRYMELHYTGRQKHR